MLNIIKRFLKFYFSATTKYGVHSPFVFDFIKNVLEDNRLFYAFHEVETIRKRLLNNPDKIEVTDLGAGSKYTKSNQRSIQQIAKSALSSSLFCRQLFRIVNHYKPKTIIEMGTSLGISAAYIQKAALNAQLTSLEGCPNISSQAKGVFKKLKLKNINIKTGDFTNTFPEALQELKPIDLIFFDGNHQKEPTINYFNQALKNAHENSIFVFDDIYWSEEMMEAWEVVKQDKQVSLSIDLFSMGILFFKKDFKEKMHFKLVPWWWKPWRLGFFK